MNRIRLQLIAMGAIGVSTALALALLAFFAIGAPSSGSAPSALALGTPTPGGLDNISGVSCADVFLNLFGDYLVPVATPFVWTVGDPPPTGASSDIAISISRTTHDPSIPSATPNITSVGITYNAGIPGVIAGAINGAAPQCSKVDHTGPGTDGSLDGVASVTTEPAPNNAVVVTNNSGSVTNGEIVYWNADNTVGGRVGFYKVTNVAGSTVNMTKTGAKCSSTPAAVSALGSLYACSAANTPLNVLGYETTNVVSNGLEGTPPRSTTGIYDPGTGLLTYTTCSASDAPTEASYQNPWTRTTVTVKVNTAASSNTSVPSYGISQLFNPTNPGDCADIAGTKRTTVFLVTWSLDSFAREGDTSKWTHDYTGTGCPDWQKLEAPPVKHGVSTNWTGGRDPFNPYDCGRSLSGIWGVDITAAPVTLSGGVPQPGAFYRCRAAVIQSGLALSVPIYCYTDAVVAGSPYTVNPAAVAGNNTCPPAVASACGDGLGGATYPAGAAGNPPHDWPAPAGPGCTISGVMYDHCPESGAQCSDNNVDDDGDTVVNDGCPSINLYGQVDAAHNVLIGTYNDVTDKITFEGCYANVAGVQGPNVYVKTTNIDGTTGHGTVQIWLAQASCAVPGGAPTFAAADVQMVHLGQLGTVQGTGYDGSLTGCADYVINADGGGTPGGKLSQNRALGGLRDPFNRWDYPDMPAKNGQIRINDVSYVIARYRHDRGVTPPLSPPYDPVADHSAIPGSNSWNLGPGDGQIRINDVSAVISQYRNDCK